jgi:1-acyl-sn-glycerol-3-phosphate acyltransferase
VVANHQSSLDVPLLITKLHRLRPKFVAMERLRFGTPAVSLLLREGGSVFVGKTNPARDLAGLARFAAGLAEFDESAVIFPAGGLQRDRDAPPFHLAGIEVLRRGGRLPILPIAIEGWREAPTIGLLANIAGGRVTLRILEPIDWNPDEPDPRASLRRLEDLIYRNVAEMRAAAEPLLAAEVPVEA